MALINQNNPVPGQVRQISNDCAQGHDLRSHPVEVNIVFPHRDQILRAEDERLQVVVVLEDTCYRGGHEGLAKANHIANEHAAALVEVMRGNFDRSNLKVEELVAEVVWQAKLTDSSACFL